jgi:hypothetical protein
MKLSTLVNITPVLCTGIEWHLHMEKSGACTLMNVNEHGE